MDNMNNIKPKIAPAPTMREALEELVNSPNAKQNAVWDRARAALAADPTPELIAALKSIMIRAPRGRAYGADMISSKDVVLDDIIYVARAALAKARGEA